MSTQPISTVYDTLKKYSDQADENVSLLQTHQNEMAALHDEQSNIVESSIYHIIKEHVQDFNIDKIKEMDPKLAEHVAKELNRLDIITKTYPDDIIKLKNDIVVINNAQHDISETVESVSRQIKLLKADKNTLVSKYSSDELPTTAHALQTEASINKWDIKEPGMFTKMFSTAYKEWKALTVELNKNGYSDYNVYITSKQRDIEKVTVIDNQLTKAQDELKNSNNTYNRGVAESKAKNNELSQKQHALVSIEQDKKQLQTHIIEKLTPKILNMLKHSACNDKDIGKNSEFKPILDAITKQEFAQNILSNIQKQLNNANKLKKNLNKPINKLYSKRTSRQKVNFDDSKLRDLSKYLTNENTRLRKQTSLIGTQRQLIGNYSRSGYGYNSRYDLNNNGGLYDNMLYYYLYMSMNADDKCATQYLLQGTDAISISDLNTSIKCIDDSVNIPTIQELDIKDFNINSMDITNGLSFEESSIGLSNNTFNSLLNSVDSEISKVESSISSSNYDSSYRSSDSGSSYRSSDSGSSYSSSDSGSSYSSSDSSSSCSDSSSSSSCGCD